MNTELKQRKVVAQRKRTRPTESTHPEEVSASELVYLTLQGWYACHFDWKVVLNNVKFFL